MPRRFTGDTLVLASYNPSRSRSCGRLWPTTGVTVRSAGGLGLAEPEETEPDFRGNAALKAHAAAGAAGLPALADDSGLEVQRARRPAGRAFRPLGRAGEGLRRRHGPRHRRYRQALRRLGRRGQARRLRQHVLCLAWPDGHSELFEGRIAGTLLETPRGAGGFGYDPIFVPEGENRTFAELSRAEKSALSHRGIAMRALLDAVFR
ncbi:MAG: non-canonical purine NTP pyrophosphatase [Geminicoccaceae bacterium]